MIPSISFSFATFAISSIALSFVQNPPKYLNNSFEIIENGTHVFCAVSGKKIPLDKLNYWNVELQEPYYSYIEANLKREKNT